MLTSDRVQPLSGSSNVIISSSVCLFRVVTLLVCCRMADNLGENRRLAAAAAANGAQHLLRAYAFLLYCCAAMSGVTTTDARTAYAPVPMAKCLSVTFGDMSVS